jgi:hypothetical protein
MPDPGKTISPVPGLHQPIPGRPLSRHTRPRTLQGGMGLPPPPPPPPPPPHETDGSDSPVIVNLVRHHSWSTASSRRGPKRGFAWNTSTIRTRSRSPTKSIVGDWMKKGTKLLSIKNKNGKSSRLLFPPPAPEKNIWKMLTRMEFRL